MQMESEIKDFYRNKTIFITGATGFLGRVTIEKLLRATEVSRIYALIRPKREKSSQERLDGWKTDPLFGVLLQTQPNALERIVAISGDCNEPDLGICVKDRELLKKETEVVIHGATTMRFTDPLHVALDTNTRATRLMLQLAQEMNHLASFIHISTAYCNCIIHHITESFYPGHLSCSADKVLKLRKIMDNDTIDKMAPALLDKFPSAYTYSKALAEEVIQMESDELPVCIIRPGSITGASREPIPGWTDSFYGRDGLVAGAAMGIVRIAPINSNALSVITPVDGCANLVIACGMQTAKKTTVRNLRKTRSPPQIYNYVPNDKNLIINGKSTEIVEKYRHDIPFEKPLWYPFLHTTSIYWIYKMATIFYHLLPGYIMDLGLQLKGQKPRMMKMYRNIHKNMDGLYHFSSGNYSYETLNTDRLWEILSPGDKQLFEFSLQTLDWDGYFLRLYKGVQNYLAKENLTEEATKLAKKDMDKLRIYHRILQFLVLCGLVALLKWLFGVWYRIGSTL